ncbi:hypothetical protein Patl1_24851 [Pistacia atlantica]|uniref:Uncharacterized protein n=1 Tax=Pistacia atlantica TaxID=434234 RepID=A0ACC1B4L7_9ROSI|nr:hypothetical protein Patl1_24851 [Pistacia atlantica]
MSERFIAFLYRLSDLGFIRISLEPSTIAKSGSMQPGKSTRLKRNLLNLNLSINWRAFRKVSQPNQMKGFQIPQQNQSRLSDLANRKSKDSHSKKKKNLFTLVPENLLPDIVKEPADFSSISEISDADESFALASLEPFNLPLTSTIEINKNESHLSSDDYHLKISNDVRSKRLLDVLVKIIVKELYAEPQEKDRLTEFVLMKTRIVSLCFLIWIIAVSVILFFNSSSGGSFIGLPPT